MLNRESYEKLIKEDIEKLNEYFPKHSVEKIHIRDVLLESITRIYDKKQKL